MQSTISYSVLFHSVRAFAVFFAVLHMLEQGLSFIELGLVKSFYTLITLFFEVPLNYLSDRSNRKIFIVAGAWVSVVWLLIMSIADSFAWFCCAEFFNALSDVLVSHTLHALLVEESKKSDFDLKIIFSKNEKWKYLGMFFCSLLGILTYKKINFNLWYINAIVMICIALFGTCCLPKQRVLSTKNNHLIPHTIFNEFKKIGTTFRFTLVLSLLFLLVKVVFELFVHYWQAFYQELQMDTNRYYLSLLFSFLLLAQSLASLMIEKFSSKIVLLLAMLLTITLILYFYFQHITNFYLAGLLSCSLFFVVRLIHNLISIRLHQVLQNELRTTYKSFLSTLNTLILLGIYPAFGYFIQRFGYVIPTCVTLLVLLFASVTLWFSLPRFDLLRAKNNHLQSYEP